MTVITSMYISKPSRSVFLVSHDFEFETITTPVHEFMFTLVSQRV